MSNELDRLGDEDEKKDEHNDDDKHSPRYLPVTRQEGFDLRGHIESAGHQVNFLIDDDIGLFMHTGDTCTKTKTICK